MAWGRIKTEHSGAKRGKGFWGRKATAKHASSRIRRRRGRAVVEEHLSNLGRSVLTKVPNATAATCEVI